MITGDSELDLLREIRDLLTLIAEPQLERRDKERRNHLRTIAGGGRRNIQAVLLMDGSRSKAQIARDAPIDPGQLSKLVQSLDRAKLLKSTANHYPELIIPVSFATFSGEH